MTTTLQDRYTVDGDTLALILSDWEAMYESHRNGNVSPSSLDLQIALERRVFGDRLQPEVSDFYADLIYEMDESGESLEDIAEAVLRAVTA